MNSARCEGGASEVVACEEGCSIDLGTVSPVMCNGRARQRTYWVSEGKVDKDALNDDEDTDREDGDTDHRADPVNCRITRPSCHSYQ